MKNNLSGKGSLNQVESTKNKIDEARANKIYDILVEFCGARDDYNQFDRYRENFVRYLTNGEDFHEWRFGGALGSGGKYYGQDNRVGYYSEDTTPEREEMVKKANEALSKL